MRQPPSELLPLPPSSPSLPLSSALLESSGRATCSGAISLHVTWLSLVSARSSGGGGPGVVWAPSCSSSSSLSSTWMGTPDPPGNPPAMALNRSSFCSFSWKGPLPAMMELRLSSRARISPFSRLTVALTSALFEAGSLFLLMTRAPSNSPRSLLSCLPASSYSERMSGLYGSSTSISSKRSVLQRAGRNPSNRTLSRYWTAKTKEMNYDDFCAIVKKEKPAAKAELLKAFRKLDPANKGFILHDDFTKVFTTRGEKMSPEEVSSVLRLADVNSGGRLDYNKFCNKFFSTCDQCAKVAVEKMEANSRAKRQQFGSQIGTSPERSTSPRNGDTTPRKVESKSLRPSSARNYKGTASTVITMGPLRVSRHVEPSDLQDWPCVRSRGCFFLEENGITSHHYRLQLTLKSTVYLTIKPLNLGRAEGKSSPWMSVDTALFVLKESDGRGDPQLVSFTELRHQESYVWKGELGAGSYTLLPFTTGCRLRKNKKPVTKEARLVYRDGSEDLQLTPEFRSALSDIFDIIDLDGSGFLSLEEYNFFELRSSGEKCDAEAWEVCKENFETKKNELTRKGFLDLNLMEANDREGDPSDLWVTLQSMGYNKALEMTEACPFLIDVYAEKTKPQLKAVSLEPGSRLLQKVLCRSVLLNGDAKQMDGCDHIVVYTYKNDTRITSVIENKSEKKIVVQVNNDQTKNSISSRGMSVFAVEVPGKSTSVSQHVMAANEKQEWLYNCVHNVLS
ncbi:EF-hand calcium-binding domain-containing protein 7 isoform X3 [Dendrobates tinctorius]|uniref:EF-hand calcium-binding domain-containing protein 7 isoform X3 n=1 Tax=Dendrobates tinctorius TaxID=92724 RepID=UPI003CC95267